MAKGPLRDLRRTHTQQLVFVPETAVRWLSPLAFIAASGSALTARTSPTASPGSSRARMYDGKSDRSVLHAYMVKDLDPAGR